MKKNIISERIKSLRIARKMTQQDVADKIGFSPGVVSQWETGTRTPRPDSLVALADMFGVTLSYLMGEDEEENEFKGLDDLHRAEKGVTRFLSALGYFSDEKVKTREIPIEEYHSETPDSVMEEIRKLYGGKAFVKDEIHLLDVWNDSEKYEVPFDDYLNFVEEIRDRTISFLKEHNQI